MKSDLLQVSALLLQKMGNEPQKKPQPRATLEDTIIQMKIQSKQVARAGKNSQKQSQQYMKKAKQALKKNNQQGAKLYLTSASQKRNQALNYQRTSIKMELMCDRIKSMKNNQKIVATFGQMTQAVSQQMANFNPIQMAQSMQVFNQKMDEVLINNKMMTEMMTNQDVQSNSTAQEMMKALKQQIGMQQKNNLNVIGPNVNINTNINKNNINQNNLNTINSTNNAGSQQQYKGNNQPKQQDYDPFLDQLKDL